MPYFIRVVFTSTLALIVFPTIIWAQTSKEKSVSYALADESSEEAQTLPPIVPCQPLGDLSDARPPCSCDTAESSACDYSPSDTKANDSWELMDLISDRNCFKRNGHRISGWIETGYQSAPDGSFTGNGAFLDDPNEAGRVNVNQTYLFAEKIADGSEGFGLGYRSDLLYGVDGNEGQSFGNRPGTFDFANGWDHGIYEWAMPQLYGEMAYDKLSVKLGHFYTPTGYEVVPPAGNFFFSRQITWYNGEPFTHTGALSTYKYSDKLSLTGGWALGWDSGFGQFNGGNMALLGSTYTLSDEISVTYFGGFGNFGWRGSQGTLNGLITSVKLTEKLSSVHQFDVLGTNNAADPVAPGGNFAEDGVVGDSVALVNYLFYDMNEKWRAGARSEWCKADGISYYTATYGLNFKPRPNFLIRPEVRHLWAPGVPGGAPGTIAANVARIYDKNNVFGMDAVWSF